MVELIDVCGGVSMDDEGCSVGGYVSGASMKDEGSDVDILYAVSGRPKMVSSVNWAKADDDG